MKDPIFSFGIISDCQYADVPDDTVKFDRRYRLAKQKLSEAIKYFNTKDLAFVVHLGDLIDQDLESFDTVLPICQTSKAPFWHVLGNHDFCGPDYVRIGAELPLQKLGLKNAYYSKQVSGYRFIILDTNEDALVKPVKDTDAWEDGEKVLDSYKKTGRINAQSWNGRIGTKQHQWLLSELQAADEAGEKCVTFSHHGIFPKHRENALNDEEMIEELKTYPQLKAYINGHNHYGDYGQAEHLHCLTVHGMVDTGENSYALAHVYTDKIEIEGFGREPSRTLTFK